jgi:hypothetical protein
MACVKTEALNTHINRYPKCIEKLDDNMEK